MTEFTVTSITRLKSNTYGFDTKKNKQKQK